MSDWIVYAVGFSQIVVLYLLALPYCVRTTYEIYLGKNRQWVHDNPAFRQRYPEPRVSVLLSYLVGAGLFGYFLYALLTSSDASWQVNLLTLPTLPFGVIYVGHAIVECFRMRRKIPRATKRSVVLERRSLTSMISPRWIYFGYLLIGLAIAAYGYAYYEGHVEPRIFVKHMIGTAGVTILAIIALIYSVRRKKQSVDELWGPSYRRGEVLFSIACLYVFSIGSIIVALQYLFSVQWLSRIDAAVMVSLFLQAGMFYMGRHSWPKSSGTSNRPPAMVG
jgi:hypothetical protein